MHFGYSGYYIIGCLLHVAMITASKTWGTWDTSGCGQQHATGFHDVDDAHTIQSGNQTRYYAVYVPKSYNENTYRKRKLIIDYHGNTDTAASQYNNSMYYKYPDGEEYLTVYPAGVEKHWQSAPYAIKGVNDLQFTTDLLAHLRQTYCIDSEHVYASGKSNGGGFVDFLACSDNGDEFAAFAMASAALYSDNSLNACSKRRAILESHGGNDTTIPYPGGERNNGTLPNIRTWISWWAQRDGCDPNCKNCLKDSGDLGGYEKFSYSCGKWLKNVVEHYKVFDLGHCWPSSTGDNFDGSRSYCTDHVLDFTPVVLKFFSRWNLRNAPKQK